MGSVRNDFLPILIDVIGFHRVLLPGQKAAPSLGVGVAEARGLS